MGPYAEMEYDLKVGYCLAVSELVNRDVGNFDCFSADIKASFLDYVRERALLLMVLFDEFKLTKRKLVIFIDPDSFALSSPQSLAGMIVVSA